MTSFWRGSPPRADGWHALPREVAAWWHARSALERGLASRTADPNGTVRANGTADADEWRSRASVAWARMAGDDVVFDLPPTAPDPDPVALGSLPGTNGSLSSGRRELTPVPKRAVSCGFASLGAGRRVLMLVQNQGLPRDRRVWNECLALRDLGFSVTAVCPADRGRPSFERLEGIDVHTFAPYESDGTMRDHVREYARSLWRIATIIRRLARQGRFAVVHAASPPDFLLLVASYLRLAGTKLVLDHHDLSPELVLSRFGPSRGLTLRAVRLAERISLGVADVVISTNESYRRIALTRGGKRPDRVFVVRNAPDLRRFRSCEKDPSLRRGKEHLILWHGVMAPQDGVDHALRALAELRKRRQDWHAAFIGDGDAAPELHQLCDELGLGDMVDFPGWLEDAGLMPYISSADIGLSPDPTNPLNEVSTMVKILEYMAAGIPVVSYDLAESRISAGEAAIYASSGHKDFADCIDTLLSDPDRREAMGRAGHARIEGALSWPQSVEQLAAAYAQLLDRRREPVAIVRPPVD